MYYPEELVEEIRSKNDIVDVIGSYVHLTKKGGSHMACCPFFQADVLLFWVWEGGQCIYFPDGV